jgi:predicted enzyme related to lactoylglutathione lyase
MPEVTKHEPGTFCWIELATSDTNAAKRFYGDLFDWSAEDMPAGEGMIYTMLRLGGKEVGALYPLEEERRKSGTPPHWFTYVAVKSADEAAQKAASLGGTIVQAPFDVMDVGRMAVLQDPTGAHFAVWEPRRHHGTAIVGEPGSHIWTELMTTDTKKAGDFYSKLFGWDREEMKMTEPRPQTYTTFKKGDTMAGGLMTIPPNAGPIPPNWLVYFGTRDVDATADRIKKLGGKLMMPPTDIPEVGRFSVAQDPQGAVFAVFKPNK